MFHLVDLRVILFVDEVRELAHHMMTVVGVKVCLRLFVRCVGWGTSG